jgi:hypothetical protein
VGCRKNKEYDNSYVGGYPLPEIEQMNMAHIIIGIFNVNFDFIIGARLFIATAFLFKINLTTSIFINSISLNII